MPGHSILNEKLPGSPVWPPIKLKKMQIKVPSMKLCLFTAMMLQKPQRCGNKVLKYIFQLSHDAGTT